MKLLHEQLKELEEKAEKIGLQKSPFKSKSWAFPFTPLTTHTSGSKIAIETTSRYEARIKMLMKIGAKENIHQEYLKVWAENKYYEVDWEEQTMLLLKEQTNLYYKITELEKKIKGEEYEKIR